MSSHNLDAAFFITGLVLAVALVHIIILSGDEVDDE